MAALKVFVLLPAFNEEPSLRELIPQAAAVLQASGRPFEMVIVNDGSRDGTVALVENFAKSLPVRILSHPVNRGYGAALATGYSWIAEHGAAQDAVISLDADRTHSPSYFTALLSKLDEGFEAVTARYTGPGAEVTGVPPLRRLMSWGANTLFRLVFRIPGAATYTNGFRVYRVSALQRARLQFGDRLIALTGFAGGTELFLKVCSLGARAAEVPFALHYENRGNDSKINLPRTIGGYLNLLKLRASLPRA